MVAVASSVWHKLTTCPVFVLAIGALVAGCLASCPAGRSSGDPLWQNLDHTISVKPATNLKLRVKLTEAFNIAGTSTAALKHLANLIPTSTVLLPI